MDLPRAFLRYENFDLAFTRIVRGGNKEYKQFYRHLFPSYYLALRANLLDLIEDLKRGTYEPERPTVVYQPKKSGVLRPLTLLSLKDIIVYQAMVNIVAVAFESKQQKFAFKRSFGAIFAGKSSLFFYRSWKTSYRKYNQALTAAFEAGRDFIADFDLVSFYELIDHTLLSETLANRVNSPGLLTLLVKCLRAWTTGGSGSHVGHGVPQGPEPSAFLAECLLFHFDGLRYGDAKYFRYVDDIRLMATREAPLRRALLRLDLQSKALGLVPQAQKIECRQAKDIEDVLKSNPSALALAGADGNPSGGVDDRSHNQETLMKAFRESLGKQGRKTAIIDTTKFKYALYRLNARRDVLRRISPFLVLRPDLSLVLSSYIRRFGSDEEAAGVLLSALQRDPTYDAAAENYIDAMDSCEPPKDRTKYRRVIETAIRRSEERSITLRIATLTFRGRRRSPAEAIKLIEAEPDARAKGIVVHRLFGSHGSASFTQSLCHPLLGRATESRDADLARFSVALLLDRWPWFKPISWAPTRRANRAVLLLMRGIGARRRAPKRLGVLDIFFRGRFKILMDLPWRKALGKDWRETERRCVRLQELLIGDPTARITLLDTFNELLIQNFSANHPTLEAAYAAATPPRAKVPDLGNWLNNATFVSRLPKASIWFRAVHHARVEGELAHAKAKKTGRPTRPISYRQAEKLMRGAQSAWAEIISEWRKIL